MLLPVKFTVDCGAVVRLPLEYSGQFHPGLFGRVACHDLFEALPAKLGYGNASPTGGTFGALVKTLVHRDLRSNHVIIIGSYDNSGKRRVAI